MQRQGGQIFGGQKMQLKNLLPPKNKLFDVSKNILPSNFNLIILVSIFLSLAMSSKLDIGILHRAHAATGTTTTMKLKYLPIGGVISLGAYNYVKIADNQFMQTEVAACPDGKTVAGKYVKCFEDSSAYAKVCTGSNYCGAETSWNSASGTCMGCGAHAYLENGACVCESDYYASVAGTNATPYAKTTALGGSCSIHYDADTGYFVKNGANYYLSYGGTLKTGCDGTMIGGFCWSEISSTRYQWSLTLGNNCPSGYSMPKMSQFYALENIFGCVGEYATACNALTVADFGGTAGAYYWTLPENETHTFTFRPYADYSNVGWNGKDAYCYVRCIKN